MLSQVPVSELPTGDLETEQVDDVPTTANADKDDGVVVVLATANAEEESAATEIDITGPIANASLNVEPVATKTNDTPVQSYAAAVGGAADASADAAAAPAGAVTASADGEGSDAADTPGAGRKMTGASKHKRNLDAQNIAATAAAQAVSIGLSKEDAVKVGAAAASELVKAYTESKKQNRSGNKAGTSVVAGGRSQPPSATHNPPSPHETQRQSQPWTMAGKPKHRKRLAQTVPYQKGTGTAIEGVSIARKKPQYLQNEALVISGMPTDINGKMLKEYINSRAKKII